MADNRRMTTDRFYGGVSRRLQNLRSTLEYIGSEHPSRNELIRWIIEHTSAGSEDAVNHHLTFLDSIDVVELSDTGFQVGEYGRQWLCEQRDAVLHTALSSGVKGFDTILDRLRDEPMTDEDIMNLLVSEFDEAEMTTPGPAIRHREWLQVLEFVERESGVNRLTSKGLEFLESRDIEGPSEDTLMQMSIEGVTVGNHYSHEEIEDAFDTGFGYRISGINPRRDSQDRPYVLLFANENGPYDDSVTQGRFEYIGEGLEGDQSESSPGNSVLIDAIASGTPVHFFYKQPEGSEWEYQGLVDVLDYEFREQGGREVIVFEMEHKEPAGELSWLDAVRQELEHYREQHDIGTITLHELYDSSERRLASRFPNNNVRAKIRQQLQRLRDRGELEFLGESTYRIEADHELKEERTELERALDSEPELTGDSERFVESRRRARDRAFTELVKDAYDNTCAFCGSSRETPVGSPEVEAAHIYPKREGGSDDVRNGVALCKLHHWAFDTGWLALSDDRLILLKEAPERNGYHEFKQLEGDSMQVPDDERAEPQPMFLEKHRQIHEFAEE